MRDLIKDKEYFVNNINYEKKRIENFKKVLENINDDNTIGKNNALMYLANFNKSLFKLSYSLGDKIENIYFYYKEWLKYYSQICTKDDSFYDIIDILSIGVFYKNQKNEFKEYLKVIVKKYQKSEIMINFCLVYLDLECVESKELKLSYMKNLLKSDTKEIIFTNILEEWYNSHQDAYWYDTHKLKNDTYCGYWCFELGAIAKILRLNDEKLKYQQYYPYDLVHFED